MTTAPQTIDLDDDDYEYEEADTEIAEPVVAKRVPASQNRSQRRAGARKRTPAAAAAKKTAAKKAAPRARPRVEEPDDEDFDDEADDETPEFDGPIEREANGVTVVDIPFDGAIYTVPVDIDDWDARAVRAFENNQIVTALENVLEGDGWARLDRKNYRLRKHKELFTLIAEQMGFQKLGN